MILTEAEYFDVLRQGLWISVLISTPILSAALLVGLIIGLFQALTSVQEMTLTFVPKVAAMLAVFWVSMSYMSRSLTEFWANGIIPLVAGV